MTSDPDEPDDESPNDGDIPEDEERSEEEIESSTDPFGSLANIRAAISSLPTIEIQNLVAPEVLRAIRDPIGPELRRALTQPVIDPELIQQLQQPAIDPELVRALQEPTIDPEVIDAMQQPPIDEATLQALSEPAIDPELIRSLESLNNSALLQAYEAAAAIEQIDEKSIEEIDEEDIEENVEEPEQGGFLSTFFNITAFICSSNLKIYPKSPLDTSVKYSKQKVSRPKRTPFTTLWIRQRGCIKPDHGCWSLCIPRNLGSLFCRRDRIS